MEWRRDRGGEEDLREWMKMKGGGMEWDGVL